MIDMTHIIPYKSALNTHSIYGSINTMEQLRIFMEHHIFSVWDFMSLVKYLQQHVAPSGFPWISPRKSNLSRFINEIVLEEESDELPNGQGYMSHYDMYLEAMREVGADTSKIESFVADVKVHGIQKAFVVSYGIPEASYHFMQSTFGYIEQNKPHVVAAAFGLGREDIIPMMFRGILKQFGITKNQAPLFHYYLERHIHLDEEVHAPLAIELLEHLCENNPNKIAEAVETAKDAIQARITFWDGVLDTMS
jgi:hypothetical protein